ncbi:hypothetical protein [Microvirga massiliensis]|uniref:hypothetical protein n=1 Tax=Microvirga massiliensis TaxID=1033741 RepID=UPI00062B2EAF|nr:hypothetical protein [Microvirga massiliensis]
MDDLDDLTGEPLGIDGFDCWQQWTGLVPELMTADELVAALVHAIEAGSCDGDLRDAVTTTGDQRRDPARISARALYRRLLTCRPVDHAEGMMIAHAMAGLPVRWRDLQPRDPILRACLNAVTGEVR